MRHFNIIKYWLKICTTDDIKYIKVAYDLMKHDIEVNPNLILITSFTFRVFGCTNVWNNQGVGNQTLFLSIVKQRLHDNFLQNWHACLEDSSRAIFYRSIATLGFQLYLDVVNHVTKYLIALSRLRLSSHRLEIEAGRWKKPEAVPFNNRVC